LYSEGNKISTGFKKFYLNGCAKALNDHFKINGAADQISNHLKAMEKVLKNQLSKEFEWITLG
jgi:hypothetical protein